jgi:MoaA/NifB/PqqE/SkfB family radical SAM enzyme
MNVGNSFRRSKLDVDSVKKIIDHAVGNDVCALSITGGEPLLYFDEIIELLKYAKEAGIKYTRTGTNGFLFVHPEKQNWRSRIEKVAAGLADADIYSFWISIDSACPLTHEKMRGLPGVIKGIESALPILHGYNIYPTANLGINRNIVDINNLSAYSSLTMYDVYRNAFRMFYQSVIDLGFTIVNACYPMSVQLQDTLNAVYGATSDSHIVQFSRAEKVHVFRALFDVIAEYRSKIRIFSPRSSVYALIKQHTEGEEFCYPCRGGQDFFFIDARDANTFPCGYRGNESFGKFWELDLSNIDHTFTCRRCDWECFRDPSELFGPILAIFTQPFSFLKRIAKDKTYMKLWYKDLNYFSACGFFNGRIPPDYKKLARF